ncbi:MAG: type VII secretion protein EccCa, partial [Streptomycetaceae bacterium]|nr:type VII secretion protein EccCa [Streptomycetaceae bacterium]
MTTRLVHRPARITRHLVTSEPRTVEAPPNLPEGKTGGLAHSLLPVAGVMSSVVMMTVLRSGQYAAIGAVVLVVTLLGSMGLLLSQRGRAQRTRRAQRERYLEYLEQLREELSAEERRRQAAARVLSPPPEALYDVVRDPARLWERRRVDPDFLSVRVGVGELPVSSLSLAKPGSTVLTPPDPFMLNEARALLHRFSTANGMPLPVPLDRVGNVSVIGERADVLRVVRALLVQAAVFHAPDDMALAVAVPRERLGEWEWAKWLPHILDGERPDGPVPARRIAPDLARLATLIGGDLRQRASYAAEARRGLMSQGAETLVGRLLVISDGYGADASDLPCPDEAVALPAMGVTVLHLVAERTAEPSQISVRVTVSGEQVTVEDLRGLEPVIAHGTVDAVTAPGAEGLARMLAALRLSPDSVADGPLTGTLDFPGLLGIDDPAVLDLDRLWAPRSERAFLRVPIGLTDARQPVLLDLKESAELGMGPHGLCVGATGSGKSELLRTLVLALAVTHPPTDLAMMLVDYKGGATFAPFADLPHTAGLITNLENDPGLIERAHASLAGEIQRRQQVLKDAGSDIADISSYAAARTTRPELPLLPHLLVVIDEFGELLTAKPDFIDLFLSIGRIGRSIGVHLLLSSQRIESGKLKGLDTYLSYRLGLRTFSADESRTVLDTPDAFHLPPLPGFGYLKVDTSTYQRFKAAYVSGPYHGPALHEAADTGPAVLPYPAYTAPQTIETGAEAEPAPAPRTLGSTELSVMTSQLKTAAEPVARIWLPPLPPALTLDGIAGPLDVTTHRGMQLTRRPSRPLRVPLGLLDDPARQRQSPWIIDLTRAGGHAAIIGGPQSGKTTLLRSLILSFSLTHTPREVGIYGVDLVGGGLAALSGLPHVGGITSRTDRERVRRTVQEVRGMLAAREEVFRAHGIDSVDQLRAARAAGRLPELGSTDVVLVIDGFGSLRDDFDDIEDDVTDLLQRGGGYGIHVVAAMLRWNDVRIATQATFGTRIELRLNDPGDSSIDRKLATSLTPNLPGRALTDGRLIAQTALPRIDALATAGGLGTAVEQAVRAVRSAWSGQSAQPVRVLPDRLPSSTLPSPDAEPYRVPVGVDQSALAPVLLDLFERDQHLIVLGDNECGKTNLLRLIAQGLIGRYGDDALVFAVIDPRRGLREVVPEPYRGGYAPNPRIAEGLAHGVAQELDKRILQDGEGGEDSGPGVTTPRVVVLVDDYDVLTTAGQQPLAAFLPHIPSAPDIGLHFVIARRVAGASRALYEPFLMALRESGSTALVMTGDRSEGQLFPGVHATPQPVGRGILVRRGEPARVI